MSKLAKNTGSSLLNQVITVICGFILPRFILMYYGSEVNGLVSSITQFLGFIALLDLGVGAVVQSAYYKPLYEHDYRTTSLIFYASKRFFRIVASILVVYVIALCFIYPSITNSTFDPFYIIALIIIISISSFAQYYFAVPNQLLLNADQRLYVQSNLQILTLVLNTAVSIGLILLGCSIHVVKLASAIVFLIRPAVLVIYVRKHYNIEKECSKQHYKIDQQWNGLAQHVATVVMNNTDVMVLTVFSTLQNVSIYAVYYMVANGLKMVINAFGNGYTPLLGEIYASGDENRLNKTFLNYEWLIHTLSCLLFGMAAVLIIPFVRIYTSGITDTNYIQWTFAILLLIGQLIFCIRTPYNSMICAAGHYRQTQVSAIIEMILNIVISITFVYKFGLIGVAIGTLVAISFRTVYFIIYINRSVINLNIKNTVKLCIVDIIELMAVFILDWVLCSYISFPDTFVMWIIHAVIMLILSMAVFMGINLCLYRKNTVGIVKRIFKR